MFKKLFLLLLGSICAMSADAGVHSVVTPFTGDPAEVYIEVNNQANGLLTIDVSLVDGTIADIYGIYFNFNIGGDDYLTELGSKNIIPNHPINEFIYSEQPITAIKRNTKDLGKGNNLNGGDPGVEAFDIGMSIGKPGIG